MCEAFLVVATVFFFAHEADLFSIKIFQLTATCFNGAWNGVLTEGDSGTGGVENADGFVGEETTNEITV